MLPASVAARPRVGGGRVESLPATFQVDVDMFFGFCGRHSQQQFAVAMHHVVV